MHPDVKARVARLCHTYSLPEGASRGLLMILELLERDATAPTTINKASSAVDAHLADSLAALELEEARSASSIVDIGSGAGFPGLALAIALPWARVVLLESIARKCVFLSAMSRELGVSNVDVVCDRAEAWTAGLGAHDLVTARALAQPATVLEYAAPLLGQGGALIEWRGRRNEYAERSAALAADELGMELAGIHKVRPFPGALEHHLHVHRKVHETPANFPRRVGLARKRPLGRLHGIQGARPR